MLSQQDVMKVVNRYIGTEGGYLGDFTYRTHREFYPEYCDLSVDPDKLPGTTRQRFIAILSGVQPREQARILLGVLDRFPVAQPNAPATRTPKLAEEIKQLAMRLDGAAAVGSPDLKQTLAVVERAIADADALLKATGATSGVDRVHTALHGHLLALCDKAGASYAEDATVTQLYKALRDREPRLTPCGARAADVERVLKSLASALDALQPVRNRASVAHPNRELLEPAEALLVINAARTILQYLDAKVG